MESENSELDKGKDESNVTSASSDEWEGEWESEEDDNNMSAGYTPLPQDPIENGENDYHHSKSEEEVITSPQ